VTDTPESNDLRRLFDSARAAWPDIEVPFDLFVSQSNGGESLLKADAEASRANAADVYLACACGQGQVAALSAFEEHYLSRAHGAAARIDRRPDFIAEVQQVLRERLLVGADAKIKEYRGTGPLAAWVRTAAVRTALTLRRAPRRASHEQDLGELEQVLDPEILAIKQRHKQEIHLALENAVRQLDSDDRLLLRLYYVDRLTLAKIASLYRIAQSTASRRLTATTQTVLANVKADLTNRLQLSTQSLDSLLRNVHDSIDVSLNQLLGSPAEP
jgi:RNA polymerase sigma-70 factor (ECF subfamily)